MLPFRLVEMSTTSTSSHHRHIPPSHLVPRAAAQGDGNAGALGAKVATEVPPQVLYTMPCLATFCSFSVWMCMCVFPFGLGVLVFLMMLIFLFLFLMFFSFELLCRIRTSPGLICYTALVSTTYHTGTAYCTHPVTAATAVAQ